MNDTSVQANAKINLALDVLGRREDGYHDLRMVMQTVSLHDTLILRPARGPRNARAADIRLSIVYGPRYMGFKHLPADHRNLAVAAARLFLERTGRTDVRLDIELIKRIPVCAGLGGGSADAAAAMRGLRRMLALDIPDGTLCQWALELGSDVPYCVSGGTRLAEGRGDVLTALPPMPDCHIVLCKPAIFISTREAFAGLGPVGRRPDIPALLEALEQGSLPGVCRAMLNVFESQTVQRHCELDAIRAELRQHGALGTVMSGSGPTILGLYDNENKARAAIKALKRDYPEIALCQPLPSSESENF